MKWGYFEKFASKQTRQSNGGHLWGTTAPPPQFYGDIFVGRVQTKPVMTNVNFTTPEDTTASAEEWMQRTVSENLAWQQAMNQATGKQASGNADATKCQGNRGRSGARRSLRMDPDGRRN
jgi:hypothetical protein